MGLNEILARILCQDCLAPILKFAALGVDKKAECGATGRTNPFLLFD